MATMFVMSEEVPSFTDTGKMWYKPSVGTVYLYLGGGWVPVTGGETVTFDFPFTIFIRGIKRDTIEQNSFIKVDAITQEVDTMTFKLYDEDAVIGPTKGEEVIVFKKDTVNSVPVKWFGGEIQSALPIEDAPGNFVFTYNVKCVDYSHRLNKELVIQSYDDDTENVIVNDIVDNWATEFSTNNVSNDVTISYISFNRIPAGQAIKEIARRIGRDFYVDYDKDIHLFQSETSEAPYRLTENIATTGHYKQLAIMVDKAQLRNRIIVTGGVALTAYDDKDIRVADGEQTAFKLDFNPRGTIAAFVDVGGGFVAKTVGIDNIDTTGFDFVINQEEGTIRNLDLAKLAAGDILKVNYEREENIVTQDDDEGSQQSIADIEGGNGIYEYPVTDNTLITVDACHERGVAELRQYSSPIIKGSFKTDQDGYRSGQLLTINMPLRGYANSQFLIQKVTSKLRRDGVTFEYTIKFATRLKSLTEFLIELFDSGKQLRIREDEVLHDLVKASTESITITGGTPTLVEFTVPYVWGAHANQGSWGEFEWG